MNDKQWKIEKYLPNLSGNILFVGVGKDPENVKHYSKYHTLVKTPETFETMDLLSDSMMSTKASKHHVCNFLDFKNEYKYDHISLHGLWGDRFIFKKEDREISSKKLSEIIISKFSYMGVEAMIYDAQVLSVHLDREKMFKIYGDSAEYVYSKNELQNFLDEKLHSKNSFTEWKKQYKEKRIEFLKEYYSVLEKKSEEIIVNTITKKINAK